MSTETEFEDPAEPGTGIKWNELNGALLLIDVHAFETGIKTAYGLADAVHADVAILDGDHAGDVYADTLIFPKIVSAQLRQQSGKKILGRVGQGVAKAGQDPPWKLHTPTDDDKRVGRAHMAKVRELDTVAAAPF